MSSRVRLIVTLSVTPFPRGNPLVESILREHRSYISGPQWLYENILRGKTTLAVAGTHGKPQRHLYYHGFWKAPIFRPDFYSGGVHQNFGVSAKLGGGRYFVIEADEYDSAFFDKRPKFLHYHPTVAVLNNLEFDHADIYDSIDEITKQFHYLMRTIPEDGQVLVRLVMII